MFDAKTGFSIFPRLYTKPRGFNACRYDKTFRRMDQPLLMW